MTVWAFVTKYVSFQLICASVLMSTSPGFAKTCFPEDPKSIVYDIVDDSNDGERLGTAFLVDWKRALFLTAQHNLGSSSLRLTKKNIQSYEFRVVASGNETFSYNLTEDWALIQAVLDDPQQGMFPLPHTELVYDVPVSSSLKNAFLVGNDKSIQGIQSIDWIDSAATSGICKNEQVVLLQVTSYDKGFSGAPLYSSDHCGVVGLSSRFAAPEDAPNDKRALLIEYFRAFSDQEIAAYDVLREVLKDQTYVKIVPARCIIDRMIDLTWADKEGDTEISKILREEMRPDASYMIKEMDHFEKNFDDTKLIYLVDAIRNNEMWHWVDLLQLLDRFYRGAKMGDWDDKYANFHMLHSAVTLLSEKKNYIYVAGSFNRAYKRHKAKYVQELQSSKGISAAKLDSATQTAPVSQVGHQFLLENTQWRFQSKTGLALPKNQIDGAPATWIAAGRRATDLYLKSNNMKISQETRDLLKNTAVGLLAVGIGKTDIKASPDKWGEGVSQIAKIADAETPQNPFAKALNEDLSVELAKAAKATIVDQDSDDWKVANRIEQRLPLTNQYLYYGGAPTDATGWTTPGFYLHPEVRLPGSTNSLIVPRVLTNPTEQTTPFYRPWSNVPNNDTQWNSMIDLYDPSIPADPYAAKPLTQFPSVKSPQMDGGPHFAN